MLQTGEWYSLMTQKLLRDNDTEWSPLDFLKETVFVDQNFINFMNLKEPSHDKITGPQIEFPIAVLPHELCINFGLERGEGMIRLSQYTIIKQNRNHPEINLHHYMEILQDILQFGEAIREKRSHYQHHMLIFQDLSDRLGEDKRIIKATIKVTREENDKRLYLQSLHFVDEDRFQIERKRGLVVRHKMTHMRQPAKHFLDFIDV